MNHLLLLTFLFGVTVAMQGVPGRRIYEFSSRADEEKPVPQTCGKKSGIVCGSDCQTQLLCAGVDKPVKETVCATINAAKKYCVGNVCTSSPDASNKECSKAGAGAPFLCTSEGIFPEPNDCTKYRYCPGGSKPSELYECPPETVFYSQHSTCLPKTQSQCFTVDCSPPTATVVPFRGNPAYYAYCIKGDGVVPQTLMYKCLDDQNEIYDPVLNTCRYNCKQVGNFVDRTNCAAYISCSWFGGKWAVRQVTCPPKYSFKNGGCAFTSKPCESEIPKEEEEKDDGKKDDDKKDDGKKDDDKKDDGKKEEEKKNE